MKLRSFVALIALGFVVTATMSPRVSAHAEYARSIPGNGATVQSSPPQVEIWFTEEVSKSTSIEVANAQGKSVVAEPAQLDLFDPDRKHVTVRLLPNLPGGRYTVTWTSVSAEDDDSETGTFVFTIDGSGTPVASPIASPGATPAAPETGTPPATKVSGGLLQSPPAAEPTEVDDRALLIALGAGVLAALLIYGFWRLVRPKRHPFDRTGR